MYSLYLNGVQLPYIKLFYKDETETKVKVEVRFDINVQRQKFLSDSITILEEFEKLVRMKSTWKDAKYINLSSRNDNKLRLLYIRCVKCYHILTIFIFECLSLVKCFLQRRKCRRIPFSESVICSVSNEIYLHHLANNDVFVLK